MAVSRRNFVKAGLTGALYGFVPKEVYAGKSVPNPLIATRLDEPIVLRKSEELSPISTSDHLTFNFQTNPFEESYTDLGVRSHSGLRDIEIYNQVNREWDVISTHDDGFNRRRDGYHVLGLHGLNPREYIEETSLTINVRYSDASKTRVQALQFNPNFYSIPVQNLNVILGGVDINNESLWVGSALEQRIRNLSFDGSVLSEFRSPSDSMISLAFDGEYLWMTDINEELYKTNREGNVLCHQKIPEVCEFNQINKDLEDKSRNYLKSLNLAPEIIDSRKSLVNVIGGLTFGNEKLWVSRFVNREIMSLHRCADEDDGGGFDSKLDLIGNAIVADSFSFESHGGGVANGGLSYSGGKLIGLSDHTVSIFSQYGEILLTQKIPIDIYYDITSDERFLWITHKKIREVDNNHDDLILSRFLLPEIPNNPDINGDGKVNAKDLLELQRRWDP